MTITMIQWHDFAGVLFFTWAIKQHSAILRRKAVVQIEIQILYSITPPHNMKLHLVA